MNNTVYGLLFLAAGLFSLAGAIFNWDWFIESRKAWLFRKLFGRTGTRIIYGVLGIVIIVMGGLVGFGIVER